MVHADCWIVLKQKERVLRRRREQRKVGRERYFDVGLLLTLHYRIEEVQGQEEVDRRHCIKWERCTTYCISVGIPAFWWDMSV
jgi:hypothetical protein